MATIKMSGIGIVEARGKLGGSVFGKNKSASVIRKYTKPNNPRTNRQLSQRANFSYIANLWRGLTTALMESWNQAAASGEWPVTNKVGDKSQPSGIQLFARLNNTLKAIGSPYIDAPPLKVSFTGIQLGALTITGAAMTLAYTEDLAGTETLQIFASPGASAGVSRPSNFKLIATSTAISPINLFSGYTSVFGTPVAGQKVFVRVEIIAQETGQRSKVGQASDIVA